MQPSLTCVEICAGAGGQALGLAMAGFSHVALVEYEQEYCNTLKANRPEWNVICADVHEFDGKPYKGVDLLAGGVPCPPFSVAGKQLGKADERDLFPEAIRLISEIQPRAVMLENVRGFLDPRFAEYRSHILESIQNLGYSVLMLRRSTYGPIMPDDNTIPMRFAKKYYNVSRIYTARDMHWLNYSCHAFVSGSDQLWNPYLEEYAGSEYFLSFVNEHNLKLSYASSFGNIDSVSDEFRNKYKKLLDRFNGITVREDYAVDICKKDFEIDAKQVCDPIFLCDFNDYKILADSSQKDYGHNYLLNFLLDPNDEKIKAYHYVLEKKGLSRFTNFTDLLECEEREKIFGEEGVNSNAEIEDFLKAYSNAEFVITDSFHGTCLAIIFNKPFISIANKKRGEKRFVSLLKWLGLMDRLIYDINEIYEKVELLESFDFSNVNNIINDSKKQGYDWLRENLSKMV